MRPYCEVCPIFSRQADSSGAGSRYFLGRLPVIEPFALPADQPGSQFRILNLVGFPQSLIVLTETNEPQLFTRFLYR